MTDATKTTPKSKKKTGPKRWVSTGYLADYYDVSLRTIYRWIESGSLPEPRRIGGMMRFDLWALEDESEGDAA